MPAEPPKTYQEILGKDFNIPPELLGPRQSVILHDGKYSTHLNTIVELGTKSKPAYYVVPLLTPNQERIDDLLKGVPPSKDQITKAIDHGVVINQHGYMTDREGYPGYPTLDKAKAVEAGFHHALESKLPPYVEKIKSALDYPTPKEFGNLYVHDEVALQALKDMKNNSPLEHNIAHRASTVGYPINVNAVPDMYQKNGRLEPGIEGRYAPWNNNSVSFTLGSDTIKPKSFNKEALSHELQHVVNRHEDYRQSWLNDPTQDVDEAMAYSVANGGTPAMIKHGFDQPTRQAARENLLKLYGDLLFNKSGGN